MPISMLIALLIAFGLDLPGPETPGRSVLLQLSEAAIGIALIALLAFGLGAWVASRVSRHNYPSSKVWRRYTQGSRVLTLVGLAVYAWILHGVGWTRLVLSTWGLQGLVLVDDLAVFLPFVVIQVIIWCGLYLADRALHEGLRYPRLPTYLILKARQALGLVLPVVLIFIIRQDVLARLWPEWHRSPAAEPLELAGLGLLVLVASPLFIRLAWPTRRLPDGPLRTRLERLARRVGFRCTDLLVWNTNHLMVNACVTGVLPWFRYVLLTDALIDSLSASEVAAVFGHEIGHVVHRHLPYFGFFFLGSLGVLSLTAQLLSISEAWIGWTPRLAAAVSPPLGEFAEAAILLGCLGLFFWVVFGCLSRRFERQADVFGCKAVSCGFPDCPPHLDTDDGVLAPLVTAAGPAALCPVGIQIFSDALRSVASLNGIPMAARSWRHGSIASRLEFLRRLQAHPGGEPGFQRGLRSFRWALSGFLLASLVLAVATRSWELLQ